MVDDVKMPLGLGRRNRKLGVLFTAATCCATLFGGVPEARADGPVTGTGKGIVGGALLGGEIVTITLAAVGIDKGWPYFVFGGVGAVGGGIGGYFVETAAPAEVPLYMLAGGMALIIPAVVASLNATAYKPPETDGGDPSVTEPAPEAPVPGPEARAPKARTFARAPHVPLSLVDVYRGELGLGVPALEVRPLYTERERTVFGVEQGHEVRVPVLRAMF